jgi:hypothetical protein
MAALCLVVVSPPVAHAQTTSPDDPSRRALIRLGPVAFQPRIDLRNIGIDTNVLNAPEGSERDFTATVVPAGDAWLRVGRAVLTSRTTGEFLYFSRHTAQRSAAFGEDVRVDVDLGRLTPSARIAHVTSFTRPSLEFDARVRRTTAHVSGGLVVALTSALSFTLDAQAARVTFGEEAAGIADALDHESRQVAVSSRVGVTRLTTWVTTVEDRRDRFLHTSLRDTNGVGVLSGFEFRPRGLLSGSALVGYRRFTPLAETVPPFSGVAVAADVRYLWREATRVGVRVRRDVEHSFEPDEPYFVETSVGVTITQLVVGMWDATGHVAFDRLGYRAIGSTGGASRIDRVRTVSVGAGYHLGFGARVGIEVTAQRRTSVLADRSFEGIRCGGVFSYGY